jgi:MFS family permease
MGVLAPSVADAFLAGFYTIYLLRYLTLADIGLLWAFWLFVLALADFPTGALADLWGARKCLLASYGLMIGAYVGLLLVERATLFLLPLFFIIHFLFAVSAAQQSGTLMAWFTNHWKANGEDMTRVREVYGTASVYSQVAALSAALAGGFLAAYLPIALVFLGAIGYCSVGALLATQLTPPRTTSPTSPRSYWGYTTQTLGVLAARKPLVVLIGISCLNYAGWFLVTYLALQPLLYGELEALTVSLGPTGPLTLEPLFLLALLGTTFSVARISGYRLSRQLGGSRDITTAFLLFTLIPGTYLFLFLAHALAPLIVTIGGVLVIAFATGLYNPHMMQFYQRQLPSAHRAAIWSLRSTASTATTILFTVLGGLLLQNLGLEYGFLLAGGLGVLSWGLIGIVWYCTPVEEHRNLAGQTARAVVG